MAVGRIGRRLAGELGGLQDWAAAGGGRVGLSLSAPSPRDEGSGFGVQGLGFGVQGLGWGVQC